MKKKKITIKSLLGMAGLLTVLGVATYAASDPMLKFFNSSKADVRACGTLTTQVSTDGITFGKTTNVPNDRPVSYYIKVADSMGPCEDNFSIQVSGCNVDGANCGTPATVGKWGLVRSDDQGVARIDLDKAWGKTEILKFALRPLRSPSAAWSNVVSLKLVPYAQTGLSAQTPINGADYFISQPGYSYIYNFKNNVQNKTGISRIQMEEKTNYCNVTTIPWRFTKSNPESYIMIGQNAVVRWLVVDPTFNYSRRTAWNQYFWADGWKKYEMSPNNPLSDFVLSKPPMINDRYRTKSDTFPSYTLLPKTISYVPTIHFINNETWGQNLSLGCAEPSTWPNGARSSNVGSWKIRIDWDNISIHNPDPGFNYDGQALRVDFFEAGSGASVYVDTPLLRESWYFVKNVGLVMIADNTFNNYPNDKITAECRANPSCNPSPPCADDSDCMASSMKKPGTTTTLKYYFHNPKLNIQVSADGVNWTRNITVSKTRGYWLKATAPNGAPYTGYLETPSGAGGRKWLAVTDGVVQVTPALLTTAGPGNYTVPFRIWVPDEAIAGETRLSDTQIPWSDTITVILTQ